MLKNKTTLKKKKGGESRKDDEAVSAQYSTLKGSLLGSAVLKLLLLQLSLT